MKPMIDETVLLHYDAQRDIYYAESVGDRVDLTPLEYEVLFSADGKTNLSQAFPGLSSRQLAAVLRRLKGLNLITTKRYHGFIVGRFILFPVANRVKGLRTFAGIFNLLLPFAAVVLFAFGIARYMMYKPIFGDLDYFDIALFYLLFSLSISAHEFGHFSAAVAYRYYVSNAGLLLLFRVIPLGAYVSFKQDNRVRIRRHKAQLFLAGIEVNFLLSGVFFLLACTGSPHAEIYDWLAECNLYMAILNLMPAPLLDGGKTLGIALGIDNYLLFMLNVFSKRNRRRLAHSGWTGWLCIGLATFGTLTLSGLIVYMGYSLILDAKAIIELIELVG